MVYKLCYIDGNKAWFTSNWKKQWGDDWGDRPYEHNAEEPYTTYFENGLEHIIPQKELYFELPYWCNVSRPCDGVTNSPYSVQDINNYRLWGRLSHFNKYLDKLRIDEIKKIKDELWK